MIPQSQQTTEEFDQVDFFILSEGIRRSEERRFDSTSHSASSGGTALAFLRRWIWVSMRRFRPPGGEAWPPGGRSDSLMVSIFYRSRPTSAPAPVMPCRLTAIASDQAADDGRCRTVRLAVGRRPYPRPGDCVPRRAARFR